MSGLWLDLVSRSAATVIGLLLFMIALVSLMRTVVIPRSLHSLVSDGVSNLVVKVVATLSLTRRNYFGRDSVLAWAGPSIIILQLITWLLLFLVAYGFLIYGVAGGRTYTASITQAGSSLFTLGFASASNTDQTAIDFFAAATGPIVIALMIGFLPTIYGTYLEREVDVTMLSGMGGEPAWGPELLSRHALADDVDALPDLFARWARWSAALRLTHVTYPVLVWVRSARATRHYAVALLAVLDAAALKVSLNKSLPHTKSFGLLLHGAQAFEMLYVIIFMKRPWRSRIPLAGMFLPHSPGENSRVRSLPKWNAGLLATEQAADVDGSRTLDRDAIAALSAGEAHTLRITRAEFDSAVKLIRKSGFPVSESEDEAWEQFRLLRVRYEFTALEICRALDATPAPWSGERRRPTPVIWPAQAASLVPDDPAAPSAGAAPEPGD